jgi:hypothetical protein
MDPNVGMLIGAAACARSDENALLSTLLDQDLAIGMAVIIVLLVLVLVKK